MQKQFLTKLAILKNFRTNFPTYQQCNVFNIVCNFPIQSLHVFFSISPSKSFVFFCFFHFFRLLVRKGLQFSLNCFLTLHFLLSSLCYQSNTEEEILEKAPFHWQKIVVKRPLFFSRQTELKQSGVLRLNYIMMLGLGLRANN